MTFLFLLTSTAPSFAADVPNYLGDLGAASATLEFRDEYEELHLDRREALLNKALASVIRRLAIPYLDYDSQGAEVIKTQGFFKKLDELVQDKDKGAIVYLHGVTLDKLLSYVIFIIHTEKQNDKKKSVVTILEEISNSTKPVSTLRALGVKPMLRLAIQPSSPSVPEKTIEEIDQDMGGFVLSASKKIFEEYPHMSPDTKSDAKPEVNFLDAILPSAKISTHRKHLEQRMQKGGSTLQWKAFAIVGPADRKMVLPNGGVGTHRDLFRDFIRGTYDYVPAAKLKEDTQEDEQDDEQKLEGSKQEKVKKNQKLEEPSVFFRGISPLFMFPHLQLSEEGEANLKADIRTLRMSEVWPFPSAKKKMSRIITNGWPGGANRFYNAKEGIEAELTSLIKSGANPMAQYIPEYVPNTLPGAHPSEDPDPCQLAEQGFLTEVKAFVKEHTDAGHLYHVTDSENVLPILTSGARMSKNGQGHAARGSGAYFTRNPQVARTPGTGGRGDFLLSFEVRTDVPLRILDVDKLLNHPDQLMKNKFDRKYGRLVNTAEFNQYLAQVCGVDIVVRQHVMVQNMGALKHPENLEENLAQILTKMLEKDLEMVTAFGSVKPATPDILLDAAIQLEALYRSGLGGQQEGVLGDVVETLLRRRSPIREKTETYLKEAQIKHYPLRRKLLQLIRDDSETEDVVIRSLSILWAMYPKDSELIRDTIQLLEKSIDDTIRVLAVKLLEPVLHDASGGCELSVVQKSGLQNDGLIEKNVRKFISELNKYYPPQNPRKRKTVASSTH